MRRIVFSGEDDHNDDDEYGDCFDELGQDDDNCDPEILKWQCAACGTAIDLVVGDSFTPPEDDADLILCGVCLERVENAGDDENVHWFTSHVNKQFVSWSSHPHLVLQYSKKAA